LPFLKLEKKINLRSIEFESLPPLVERFFAKKNISTIKIWEPESAINIDRKHKMDGERGVSSSSYIS